MPNSDAAHNAFFILAVISEPSAPNHGLSLNSAKQLCIMIPVDGGRCGLVAGAIRPRPLLRGIFEMQTGFTARFALWAAVGAAIGGLAPSASASVITYNRNAAVNYANANYNKVVSDGYFWINGSTSIYYGAGQPVPVNVANEAGGIGDDCAHFVSSCIGSPAGGLTIPSRAGTYGEPGAARLDELLVGSSLGGYGTTYDYGTLVSSVSQLTPGDIIGYDWDGSGDGSMSGIDHTVVYLGNGEVAAHAASHDDVAWNFGNTSSTITFFIHITLPDSIVPTAPNNSSPPANSTVTILRPRLTANAFSDGAIGSTHTASEWEIFKAGTLVYDTGTDTTDLLGLTVPTGILRAGNSYTYEVRYEDNYGDWSSYSQATNFSVTAVPEPSSFALMATAAGLFLIRRRRSHRQRRIKDHQENS
jgi:hypothetical protein